MGEVRRSDLRGEFHHVVSRGNLGTPIVVDDVDRQRFVDLLRSTARRYRLRIHAWCLMGNHYHLAVEGPVERVSKAMQRLNSTYARRFNERHGLAGHLFRQRFWSEPLEGDDRLTGVALYIFHNPVRHRFCRYATEWRWSGGGLLANLRTRRIRTGPRLRDVDTSAKS